MGVMSFINWLDGLVWGPPIMILLLGTGIFLTILLRGIQITRLGWALRYTFGKEGRKKRGEGDISPFQALMATLSGTVGIGNIAGVATAIYHGGPGALFWMWMTALFGMATRGSEGLLGVAFRDKLPDGTMIGGTFNALEKGLAEVKIPAGARYLAAIFMLIFAAFIGADATKLGGGAMVGAWIITILFLILAYYLVRGHAMPSLGKVLAILFSTFAAIAAFGIGNMTQSNSLALGMNVAFHVPFWVTGVAFAILTFLVTIGGIKRIGEFTGYFVPFMAIVYFIFAIGVWLKFAGQLPHAIGLIFKDAFTGKAVAGGAIGTVIRWGVARGLFSNEAGLGTATMAHSAARTDNPSRQGHVAMLGPLIDTLIICSLTGISIVATGAWQSGKTSTALTQDAFARAFGHIGAVMVVVGVIFFAYSTVITWNYYGRQNIMYLTKWITRDPKKFAKVYHPLHVGYNILWIIFIYIGAVGGLESVWNFSDMMNGLMAIPNLLGLILLYPVIKKYTNEFIQANP